MNDRDHGQIIFWSDDRNYGFIRRDGERDIFLHQSALPEGAEVRSGDYVSFEIGADKRPGKEPRICAVDVRFVNGGADVTAPGMYASEEASNTALAAGLKKLLNQ
jgi:cold shock CspA family protein